MTVFEFVAHLADRGVWIALNAAGSPRFHAHADADLDGVDEAVIDELHARAEELVAWLKKPLEETTDEELEALGFSPAVRDPKWLPDEEWYVVQEPLRGAERRGGQVTEQHVATSWLEGSSGERR